MTDFFITTIARESPAALDELKRWAREELRLMRSVNSVMSDFMMNNCPFALQAGFFIEFITWYNQKHSQARPLVWGYGEKLKADIRMAMLLINQDIKKNKEKTQSNGCIMIDFNSRDYTK